MAPQFLANISETFMTVTLTLSALRLLFLNSGRFSQVCRPATRDKLHAAEYCLNSSLEHISFLLCFIWFPSHSFACFPPDLPSRYFASISETPSLIFVGVPNSLLKWSSRIWNKSFLAFLCLADILPFCFFFFSFFWQHLFFGPLLLLMMMI